MAPTTRSSKRRAIEGPQGVPEPSPLATVPEEDTYAESNDGRADTPGSEVESGPKPARKRTRRTRKDKDSTAPPKSSKQVRVKGKLEMFKNVPVEVFIEIAKYLHPFDLVLLSRVNKFFRELFMSRQAASIWTSARQSVSGLPPCPPELCEPQYAALLFTKMCSQCGKYAPRHMDPGLLVRFCSKCREEQYNLAPTLANKITDFSLVARSFDNPPRNLRHYGRLYLTSDIEAVESKLKELKASGDQDALVQWQRERRKVLQDRYMNARLFTEWFRARDSERDADLTQRKDAHEAQVTARLISLGWEEADHLPHCNPRRKQWLSLARAAKVLTDHAWEKLFPQLLEHLKINKEERLARERSNRRLERYEEFERFWHRTKKELPPLLQATPIEETASLLTNVSERNTLRQAFLTPTRAYDWPEYKQLLEEDIPGTEFKLILEGKRDSLLEFVQKWRVQLEEMLIQRLPDHIEPPNFDAPGLTLTSDDQPANNLFAGTQMLLRADVAFMRSEYDTCNFYPEDFNELPDPSRLSYDTESSDLAVDLLCALGRPGATHLEMRSLGHVFQCGRCISPLGRMTWKALVQHYKSQKSAWDSQCKAIARHTSKEFTYVFTHDTKVEKPNKPLVQIVDENEPLVPQNYSSIRYKQCMPCRAIEVYVSHRGTEISDHLRDAHLIEEPEEGKHFR